MARVEACACLCQNKSSIINRVNKPKLYFSELLPWKKEKKGSGAVVVERWGGREGTTSQMLCVSPRDFISNVLLTSGKSREEVKGWGGGGAFWCNLGINLSANDRRS